MSKFIPNTDLEQLHIEQLTFHLIQKDLEQTVYMDEINVAEQQYDFFETLIHLAISKGGEYDFLEEESETVLAMIEALEDENDNLKAHSATLAKAFWKEHQATSSDGLLMIATIQISSTKMLFLAKLDYQNALKAQTSSFEENQQKITFADVENALFEHESTIQKAALIDIDANYDWDVLAMDNQKSGAGLADYFQRFLHVQEKEINAILSTQVVAEVQKWASKNSEEVLQPAEHVADYKERAVSYLRAATEFDTHELMDVVIAEEENLERKQELSQSLYAHLEQKDLAHRNFEPNPEGIRGSVVKNKIQTKEGVSISWEGDMDTHGIQIKEVDGEMQIIISTSDYTFK